MDAALQQNSPFLTGNTRAYADWRAWKLAQFQILADKSRQNGPPVHSISNPQALSTEELAGIRQSCRAANWALFSLREPAMLDEQSIKAFAAQLGMRRLDANLKSEDSGISAIQVKEQQGKPYIPYTNHQLNWHTDGYYNSESQQIHGWLLYCVRQADEGGANTLLDHEMLYIQLRDEDPALIDALMHPCAMTIPANEENGIEIRPAHSGPVFAIDPWGNLHMRYSARARNIHWRDDAMTTRAVSRISELLNDSNNSARVEYRLKPGEGLISNNVLHRRDAFTDNADPNKKRLIYRARFYDRLAHTGFQE